MGSTERASTGPVCPHVQWLSELSESEFSLAGGKAANLARMTQDGVHVPEAFVVLSPADCAANDVQSTILHRFDELGAETVAVRSSARCEDGDHSSYAGFFDTHLLVDRKHLLSKVFDVQQCMSDPTKAERYQMAVLVQRMVIGQTSGVCFSMHPVAHDGGQLLIEAVDGLGTSLVSGTVTPARYCVDRHTLAVGRVQSEHATSHPLADIQVRELARMTLRLEQLFGRAVDVEWTISDGILCILQCRPITASTSAPKTRRQYKHVWSTTEPMWTMELGIKTRARLLPPDYDAPTLWSFDDLFYAKIGAIYECHVRNQALRRFRPTDRAILSLLDDAGDFYSEQQQFFTSIERRDFRSMSPKQLIGFFDEVARFYCRCIGLYSCSGSLVTSQLEERLRKKLPFNEFLAMLRSPVPDVMELEQADWSRLVQHECSAAIILDHVRKYPYLALNLDTRSEVLSVMRDLYQRTQSCMGLGCRDLEKEKLDVRRERDRMLSEHPSVGQLVAILHRLSSSRMQIKSGWAGVGFFLMPFFAEVAERSGESVSDIMAFYQTDEIKNLIVKGVRLTSQIKKERSTGCIWHARNGAVEFLEGPAAVKAYQDLTGDRTAEVLAGTVASIGIARGAVRVVNCNDTESTRNARASFQPGDILVTEMAQPSMIDLISKSAAVVTDEGGLLSHAAIVCRELGIPCLVAVESATKRLVDGQVIEINEYGEIKHV